MKACKIARPQDPEEPSDKRRPRIVPTTFGGCIVERMRAYDNDLTRAILNSRTEALLSNIQAIYRHRNLELLERLASVPVSTHPLIIVAPHLLKVHERLPAPSDTVVLRLLCKGTRYWCASERIVQVLLCSRSSGGSWISGISRWRYSSWVASREQMDWYVACKSRLACVLSNSVSRAGFL